MVNWYVIGRFGVDGDKKFGYGGMMVKDDWRVVRRGGDYCKGFKIRF